MKRFGQQIAAVISANDGLSARDIARCLRSEGSNATRREVNATLHRGGPWVARGDSPPLWFSCRSAGSAFGEEPSVISKQSRAIPRSDAGPTIRLTLYPWQEEAYAAWRSAGRRGVVEAVTGTGKTRLGIVAAIGQSQLKGVTLIVVPSIMLMEQWEDELQVWLPGKKIGRYYGDERSTFDDCDLIVGVVNSVRNMVFDLSGRTGLLIADECRSVRL